MSLPLVLFSLVPLGDRAIDVVNHPRNKHLVGELDGCAVLDIGHVRSKSSKSTLATLGRAGDVVLEGSSFSRIHCSFEISQRDNVVMFYDRSHNQTSQVSGDNAVRFEYPRARKVVVLPGVNNIIGMGGVGCNLVQFHIRWKTGSNDEVADRIKCRNDSALMDDPMLAPTLDATVPQSQRETRIHTPGHRVPPMRSTRLDRIGFGEFGVVHKAVDMDTGRLMAVKILKTSQAAGGGDALSQTRLKREVELLAKTRHPHIVEYIASEGLDGPEPNIFMGLLDGNLASLIYSGGPISLRDVGNSVMYHILQALDYLAAKGIIHRDVKPENILYSLEKDHQYHFQLGDFGLSNFANAAISCSGTPNYMAPEIDQGDQPQTHKLDVWSLYVTMLWIYDVNGFRQWSTYTVPAILSLASEDTPVSPYSAMARKVPVYRASAAQMLVKCFDGKGLTTPRNQVMPILDPPEATRAEVKSTNLGAAQIVRLGQFQLNGTPYEGITTAQTANLDQLLPNNSPMVNTNPAIAQMTSFNQLALNDFTWDLDYVEPQMANCNCFPRNGFAFNQNQTGAPMIGFNQPPFNNNPVPAQMANCNQLVNGTPYNHNPTAVQMANHNPQLVLAGTPYNYNPAAVQMANYNPQLALAGTPYNYSPHAAQMANHNPQLALTGTPYNHNPVAAQMANCNQLALTGTPYNHNPVAAQMANCNQLAPTATPYNHNPVAAQMANCNQLAPTGIPYNDNPIAAQMINSNHQPLNNSTCSDHNPIEADAVNLSRPPQPNAFAPNDNLTTRKFSNEEETEEELGGAETPEQLGERRLQSKATPDVDTLQADTHRSPLTASGQSRGQSAMRPNPKHQPEPGTSLGLSLTTFERRLEGGDDPLADVFGLGSEFP